MIVLLIQGMTSITLFTLFLIKLHQKKRSIADLFFDTSIIYFVSHTDTIIEILIITHEVLHYKTVHYYISL